MSRFAHIVGTEAMLAGELEYRRGNYDKAFEHLREAVNRDDALYPTLFTDSAGKVRIVLVGQDQAQWMLAPQEDETNRELLRYQIDRDSECYKQVFDPWIGTSEDLFRDNNPAGNVGDKNQKPGQSHAENCGKENYRH